MSLEREIIAIKLIYDHVLISSDLANIMCVISLQVHAVVQYSGYIWLQLEFPLHPDTKNGSVTHEIILYICVLLPLGCNF